MHIYLDSSSHYTHMAMSIVVRKSTPIVVRPSEPVTTSGSASLIKLSPFDKGLDKVLSTVLLAFEHPIHETVETIKRALSQALVHYYPFAGRLVAAADIGDEAASHIQCSGDGVVFVAASASCALKEAILSNDLSSAGARTLLQKLTVQYPDDRSCGGRIDDRPLLLMQVTEFSCCGFVLGVAWNHAVADGAGMGQFLQAIGELARGLPLPTIVPVRSVDDSLPRVPADKVIPMELIMPHPVPFSQHAFLDITVPSSLVGRIKDEFGIRFNGQACTLFDTVSALMWKCHTRATMSDPDAPALLLFSANVRKHVGLKKGYYGNCVTIEIVRAKCGTVAHGDIIDLVALINHSKEKIGDQFRNNTGSSLPQQSAGQNQQRWQQEDAAAVQVPYNVLTISSWRNLGLDEADFGSGRPARIVRYVAENQPSIPIFVLVPECKRKVGSTFSATMMEGHAEAFLRELASFT